MIHIKVKSPFTVPLVEVERITLTDTDGIKHTFVQEHAAERTDYHLRLAIYTFHHIVTLGFFKSDPFLMSLLNMYNVFGRDFPGEKTKEIALISSIECIISEAAEYLDNNPQNVTLIDIVEHLEQHFLQLIANKKGTNADIIHHTILCLLAQKAADPVARAEEQLLSFYTFRHGRPASLLNPPVTFD